MTDFVYRNELALIVDQINEGRAEANEQLKEFIGEKFDHLEERMEGYDKDLGDVKDDVKSWKKATSILVTFGTGLGFLVSRLFKS